MELSSTLLSLLCWHKYNFISQWVRHECVQFVFKCWVQALCIKKKKLKRTPCTHSIIFSLAIFFFFCLFCFYFSNRVYKLKTIFLFYKVKEKEKKKKNKKNKWKAKILCRLLWLHMEVWNERRKEGRMARM